MSDAKRCDRCGGFYELPVSYPTIDCSDESVHQINDIGNVVWSMDLCQDCWESFKKWVEEVRK